MNPLSRTYHITPSDQELVSAWQAGNHKSLNTLLERHQPYIYNLAWKMIGDPDDAADLSQEVLLKIAAQLDRFRFQSSFRTWAYRIVVNHFLNWKKKIKGFPASNFDDLGAALDQIPNVELSPEDRLAHQDMTHEVRLRCLAGMLLCLNQEQRMVYIIGEIFAADHTVGSEIMGISKANFRMKLSKARKDLYQFMRRKCGLVNPANPCRCHKKVTVSLEYNVVSAKHILFNRKEYGVFLEQIEPDAHFLSEDADAKIAELQWGHSYKENFQKRDFLQAVLDDPDWKAKFQLK